MMLLMRRAWILGVCLGIAAAVHQALRGKQIFFVGGVMKSGTTCLQLLLNAHPEVSCHGEGHFPDYLALGLKEGIDKHWKAVADKNRGHHGPCGWSCRTRSPTGHGLGCPCSTL